MAASQIMRRIQILEELIVPIRSSLLLFLVVLLCYTTQTASAGLIKSDCKKVGWEELIDEEKCDLMIVRVNRCSGSCLSFTFPNPLTGKTAVHAKCCRMIDTEWIHLELDCEEGKRPIKIPSAVQCECFDCALSR